MKLLIAACTILLLTGCSSVLLGGSASGGQELGTDNRSTAQMNADDRLTATIRSRFDADAGLASLDLGVETRRGAVTLRGAANSFELRDRALNLAADVAGVVRIDNQISVNTR